MNGLHAVLDTNVLLLPFTDGCDVPEELIRLVGAVTLVVPSSIAQELEGLAKKGNKPEARAAKAAKIFLKRCTIERTQLPGDDGILDVSRRLGAVVVTNDRKLQIEAKRSGLTVVGSRGHGRLYIVER